MVASAKNREKILELPFNERFVPVWLVRSRRTTLGIRITEDLEVLVSAPLFIETNEAKRLVLSRQAWIAKHLQSVSGKCGDVRSNNPESRYFDGAVYPFLGKGVVMHWMKDETKQIRCRLCRGEEDAFLIKGENITAEACARVIELCMRRFAAGYLKERTAYWAEICGVDYGRIAIKGGTSRWGSASSAGNLNLQWRLVMMPVEISDYVIVHELCHRKEMNHSARFWAEVEKILPDYRERRKWLKNEEAKLMKW